MTRWITAGTLILGIAGCAGPQLTADEQAALDANIARNAPLPATTTADNRFRVSVSASRKVALVTLGAPSVSIAEIEAAATGESGCPARALPMIYEEMGGDRDAPLTRSLRRGFGGQIPVLLSC